MLDHKVFIGSFHKTGTVLMGSIWRRAAKRLEFGQWIRHEQPEPPAAATSRRCWPARVPRRG